MLNPILSSKSKVDLKLFYVKEDPENDLATDLHLGKKKRSRDPQKQRLSYKSFL